MLRQAHRLAARFGPHTPGAGRRRHDRSDGVLPALRLAAPEHLRPHRRQCDDIPTAGLPATFFLDRQHHVLARIVGGTNLAGFDAVFRRALS